MISIVPAQSQEYPREQPKVQDHTNAAAYQDVVHEGFWRKTMEDPVAAFTGVLALFTVALVGVSVVQIGFLIRADRTASVSADASKAAADASVQAAFAAMKQADLAERTLVGLERPHLLLGAISAEVIPATDFKNSPKDALVSLPRAKFSIENFGRSPCVLKAISYRIFIDSRLPEGPEYFKGIYRVEERFVAPGKTGFEGEVAVERWLNVEQAFEILSGQSRVFFVGFLEYADLSDVSYKTGFGLVYVPRNDRFITTGEKAYNYRM